MVDQVTAALMVSSLALLGSGYIVRSRWGYLLQSMGWIVMAGFWAFRTVIFEAGNASNGVFTALGAAFSLYLSYYAFAAFAEDGKSGPLRFISGMSVIAGALYYPAEWSTEVGGWLVHATAVQTAWALNAVGYNVHAGSVHVAAGNVFVPIENTNVSIILACTAIQAFALFTAAIIVTEAPWKVKIKGLAFSLLIIHSLNIVRNVGIIVLVNDHGVDFEFAHSGLGKLFSLLVLIFILYRLFEMIPSLYDNIIGLFSLDSDRTKNAGGGRAGANGGT